MLSGRGWSTWRSFSFASRRNPAGLVGLAIVLSFTGVAILAPFISPFDPVRQDLSSARLPPFWLGGPPGVILGTDSLGRDVFSRILYGSRVSMIIGISAVGVAGSLGSMLGLVSGFRGGRIDAVIMRLVDLQLSIPFLVLAIAAIGAVGPSLLNVIVVLGLTGWVPYARVVRGEVLGLREREFITAARAVGVPERRIIMDHLRPNVTASVIVIASVEVARMIISEAALSFLGLGLQPPTPSWGGMVAEGRGFLESAWWIATFPGLAISMTVLGINLLGDWLRDVLDPYMRRSG